MSNNENIAHKFVYGQDGKGSNFRSIDNTLYSYSSILARKDQGLIIISSTIANYSSTSGRHMLHLSRALNYDHDNIITVHRELNYNESRKDLDKFDLVDNTNSIKDLLKKQSRARKYNYFNSIDKIIKNGQNIIKFGSVDKRSIIYKEFISLIEKDLEKDYKSIIAADLIADKKRKLIADNKAYKRNLEKIEDFTGSSMKQYSKSDLNTFDFLRIDDVSIRSHRNVSVDIAAARILYNRYKTGKSINGLKIGSYTIINYNKKFVTIGCHKILFKELERVFKVETVLKSAA